MATSLIATILAFSSGVAHAAAGDLDLSFGFGGKLSTGVDQFSTLTSVAVQPDGKVIAAGVELMPGTTSLGAVVRFNADGSLDPSFGVSGTSVTNVGSGDDFFNAMALQPDGKIVAAGGTGVGSARDVIVVRYSADGSLDTSFSDDGRLTTDFGAGGDVAAEVLVQSDGKIVIAGEAALPSGLPGFGLVRYNTDGSLDTSFDGDGTVTTDVGGFLSAASSALLQPDGKIVAAGYNQSSASTSDFATVRYNTDGSLDTSFGGDGTVTTDFAGAHDTARTLTLQDGKIVAGGNTGDAATRDLALARYNTDGSLDTSFDGDGTVTTALSGAEDGLNQLVTQSDGKIVAVGDTGDNQTFASDFGLVRYNTDGSLDTSFGGDGIVTTDIAFNDLANAAALQPDGNIIAAGRANTIAGLARYNTDGGPPPVNEAPVAADDSYTTGEDSPLTVAAPGVLSNDTDGDGDPLTAVKVSDPAHGAVTLNTDGSFTYTPAAGYSGPDSFTYRANDGSVDSNVATVAITVTATSVAPAITSADATTFTVGQAGTFTVSATGNPTPSLTRSGVDLPTGVTFTDNGDGTATLAGTPDPATAGTYALSFIAANGVNADATQQFTLTVEHVADTEAPVITFLPASVVASGANAVLPFDVADASAVTVTVDASPVGIVTAVVSGSSSSRILTLSPEAAGSATVTVTVTDAAGNSSTLSFLVISGDGGSNTIFGTEASEVILGGPGNDTIYGLGGDDLIITGGGKNDTVDGGTGNDMIIGGAGNDRLLGGDGNDIIHGGSGNDVLEGDAGDDELVGEAGNDTLKGGPGTDILNGGPGRNRLHH